MAKTVLNTGIMTMMMMIQKKMMVLILYMVQERWILKTEKGQLRGNSAMKWKKGIKILFLISNQMN